MVNLGKDISSDWTFNNGDLVIVENYGNMGQAVVNRLNTDLGFYDVFYGKYGGELWQHLGDLNIPTIHEYIRIEIEDILKQDPRIKNSECTVNKINSKGVECHLIIGLYDNSDTVTLNLVIDTVTGVSIQQNTMEET